MQHMNEACQQSFAPRRRLCFLAGTLFTRHRFPVLTTVHPTTGRILAGLRQRCRQRGDAVADGPLDGGRLRRHG